MKRLVQFFIIFFLFSVPANAACDFMIKIGEKSERYSLNKPFKAKGIYEQPNLIYLYNNLSKQKESIF